MAHLKYGMTLVWFALLVALGPLEVHAVPLGKLLDRLPDSQGKIAPRGVSDSTRLQVIVFLGCDCPLAKLYGPRLATLASAFHSRGVTFIGVNSNPQDSLEELARYVAAVNLPFVLLKDFDQDVARYLSATRTPEAIVLDAKGREVYRGRIDDQYQPGMQRPQPSREDLKIALEEYLDGRPIAQSRTTAAGCLISLRKEPKIDSPVTYCQQIVHLLDKHCIECHRPGEIGPFSMTEFSEIVGWAEMMLETMEQRRMPPWNANPDHGDFLNARRLPEEDLAIFRQWVEAGTPYGDPPLLASATAAVIESLSSAFDREIPMSEVAYQVPAEGTVDYQYFVVDPGFKEGHWVQSAEIVPRNRAVVHHAIAFVRPPDGVPIKGIGWLAAYVPGQVRREPPPHRARWIPAGSKIVFQMHYTPNGQPQQDLSSLRLKFANPEQVTEEHISVASLNQELEIPPGEANVVVEGASPDLPSDGILLAMSPHMHLRGKSIRVHAKTDAEDRILLDVPNYDFNWQHTYILRTPLPLRSLKSLTFTASFDNSTSNPFNPDPTAFVTWGDQTWEEMAIVFYEVAIPLVKKELPRKKRDEEDVDASTQAATSERHLSLVEKLFVDLDRDRDGTIEYEEVDQAVQLRSFGWYDSNRDRKIEFQEAVDAMQRMGR